MVLAARGDSLVPVDVATVTIAEYNHYDRRMSWACSLEVSDHDISYCMALYGFQSFKGVGVHTRGALRELMGHEELRVQFKPTTGSIYHEF